MVAAMNTHCANCRRPILGASPRLIGVHARCWRHAGERIRRVRLDGIERPERAEIAAWVRDYNRAERELLARMPAGYEPIPAAWAEDEIEAQMDRRSL